MKIESFRQVQTGRTNERTNERRLAFLELLSEPKRHKLTCNSGFNFSKIIVHYNVFYAVTVHSPAMILTWGLSRGLSMLTPAQILTTRISLPAAVNPME